MTSVSPKPVLFLDDERSYVELMGQLLTEHLTCEVLAFTSPLEALAALPRLGAGMIVTDYYMPKMSGIEFIRRAREACPDVVAIMITGHQIELAEENLSEVPGLRATIFKPVTWRVLAENIIKHWPDAHPPTLKPENE